MSKNTQGPGGNRSTGAGDRPGSAGSVNLVNPAAAAGKSPAPNRTQPKTGGRKTQSAVIVKTGTDQLPAACVALREMAFEGNIIPRSWWQTSLLRMPDGKPNLPAAILLSDVVFFYRPYEEVDEKSGLTIGWKKRFSMDKMWKDYEEWGASFGLTKRQVKDAVAFLKKAGLITVEFRTLWIDGMRKPNRPFIEPVIERLRAITYSASEAWRIARSTVTIIEYEEENGDDGEAEDAFDGSGETFEPGDDQIGSGGAVPTDDKRSCDVITTGSENGLKILPDVITSHIPDDKTEHIPDVITSDIIDDKTADITDVITGDLYTKINTQRIDSEIRPEKSIFTENDQGISLSPDPVGTNGAKAAAKTSRERENISSENTEKVWLKEFLRGTQIGQSKFNFKTCTAFADYQQKSGKPIRDAVAVGAKYLKEAIMDDEIEKWLDNQHAPREIIESNRQEQKSDHEAREFIGKHRRFCPACYGSGMEVVKGKGARKCECPLLTVEYLRARLSEENEQRGLSKNPESALPAPLAVETVGGDSGGSQILAFRNPAVSKPDGGSPSPLVPAAELPPSPIKGDFPDKARAIYHIALEGRRATLEKIESDWRMLFDEPSWQQIKVEIVNLMKEVS